MPQASCCPPASNSGSASVFTTKTTTTMRSSTKTPPTTTTTFASIVAAAAAALLSAVAAAVANATRPPPHHHAPSAAAAAKPPSWWGPLRHAGELATSALRMLAALLLAAALAPAIAPAIFIRLPDCLLVRALERVAVRASTLVAQVAGVRAHFGTTCDLYWPDPDDDEGAATAAAAAAKEETTRTTKQTPRYSWLPPPIVRAWESPLSRGRIVKTFDQPGRWMTDAQLETLRETLLDVARNAMDVVPHHRLFSQADARAVYSNRIISVAFDAEHNSPIGFTAMVYLPYPPGDDILIHLGLTMISIKARRTRLQSPMFIKCFSHSILNMCRTSFMVTNIAASPAGVGSVCDYFLDAYPHYLAETQCQPMHLSIAHHVLKYFRHEFGCSQNAVFDPETFVVRGSNQPEGGGSSSFIKEDGKPVSQHKNPRCNEFVVNSIDLTAGDELFQVARFDLFGTLWAYLVGCAGPASGLPQQRRAFARGKDLVM